MVAEIILTPANGPVGTVVTVDGTGFTPLGTATIKFATVLQATTPTPVTIDGAGVFSCTFVVPAAVEGANAVLAEDGVLSDSADFTVEPQIVITQANAIVGDTIDVIGTGYTGVSAMSFTLGGVAIIPVGGAISSDATGGFTTTFLIPDISNGSQTLVGTDAAAKTDSDTIIIDAHVVITENNIVVGGTINFTGTGFNISEAISFTFNGVSLTPVAPVTSDADGGFTGSAIVPAVPNGSRTLVATDVTLATDSDTVIVDALFTITEANCIVGQTINFVGSGFAASEAITFEFAGSPVSPVGAVTSGSNGSFSGQIVVPAAINGSNTIAATDVSTNTDDDTILVDANLVITEASANVGDTINVIGTGYDGVSLMAFTLSGDAIVPVGGAETTDATGGFVATFVIPAIVNGTATLEGTDAGANVDDDTIVINAKIITNPDTGEVGSEITVIGTGYATVEAIEFRVDGILATPLSAVTTDATGGFTGTITIPSGVSLGSVNVSATDVSLNTDTSPITISSALEDPSFNGPMAYRKLASGLYTNPSEQVDGTNMESIIQIDARNYDKVLFVIQNVDDRSNHNLDYNIFGSLDVNGDNPPAFSTATWAQILTSDIEVAIGATKSSVVTEPYIWLCLAAKKHAGDDESIASIFIRGINSGHNS